MGYIGSARIFFYSGTGSHDHKIVQPYVKAITAWLSKHPQKLSAVDLGCGDFSVGSQIRSYCSSFTACDIVPELITSHQNNYRSLDVDFRCLDLAQDELPQADVVFVRQVLQHLDNHSISQFCSKLTQKFSYLILTEHIPRNAQFVSNRDKPSGPDTRIGYNSGVVLTDQPFKISVQHSEVLCEVSENGGVIQTIAYQLK
ncbi:MAG: class I SAM-dependent methyltransferase [Brachymonas sp.]|nr:class I SAM-dependent methyltransferase [Brachymonas sp.]